MPTPATATRPATTASTGTRATSRSIPTIELVTATAVTPGNAGDASVALDLLADELAGVDAASSAEPLTVYGDSAYGAGPVLAALAAADARSRVKVQPSSRIPGHYSKDDFVIDLAARTVTCPAGRVAPFQGIRDVRAEFGRACSACPLVAGCTSSRAGRVIAINPHEALLAAGRAAGRDPAWRADYRATRPKVERKIAHLVRRHHGGRRARVRGRLKVGADFALLAAAINLARLAVLGLFRSGGMWAPTPAGA